jgi:hypothetical protein
MTDAETLEGLADRVERLSGPDFDVDRDIAIMLGWTPFNMGGYTTDPQGKTREGFPKFTASLDAAMTLIEGPKDYPGSKTFVVDCAGQTTVHFQPVAHVWSDKGKHTAKARTPALALTAAALRARASILRGEAHD